MKRTILILVYGFILMIDFVSAEAQQQGKVPRIGYLSATDPARESARAKAIRQALRELGYT